MIKAMLKMFGAMILISLIVIMIVSVFMSVGGIISGGFR